MKTLRDLLGKPILFHWLPWHGKDGKSLTGYDSRDISVIKHQLLAMLNIGGEGCGVIALTYGPTVSTFIHQAVMEMCNQCNAFNMPFALCMDPWTVKNTPDINATMIAALTHPDIQFMLNSDSYLYLSGKKPVLDFATGCNKSVIQTALPGLQYWLNGVDYDWVRIPSTPNKTQLPCTFIEFNDGTGPDRNKQVWNQTLPVRIVPSLGGGTFWGRVSNQGQYIQFCTWNDVAEGTDIEKFASMMLLKI